MNTSSDMPLTIFAAIAIGLVCAPKRAFSLLIALDVVLILLIEAYASTRMFHDFGDSLFKFASATLLASGIAFCVLAGFIYLVSPTSSQGGGSTATTDSESGHLTDPDSGASLVQMKRAARLFHLAGLTGVIFPYLGLPIAFALWLWKRKEYPFTAYHVTSILVFHLVFAAGLFLLAVLQTYVLFAWYLAGPVLMIRAAVFAGRGQYRSYPFMNKLFDFWKKRSGPSKTQAE